MMLGAVREDQFFLLVSCFDLERPLLPEDSLERIRTKLRSDHGDEAKAAVGVVFKRDKGVLELLLVKRAEVTGDPWSGDMAFPGGKRCPDDNGLIETVIREVYEETNIDLRSGHFLGVMDLMGSTAKRGMTVLPMVFLMDEEPEIRINEELAYYLWTPFRDLVNSRGKALVKNRYDTDVFHVGDDVVWGLTYRMLERLIKLAIDD